MLQKKICMLGTFAVGKTSLVRQFVESIYSEEYHTTVGVKIDNKIVRIGNRDLRMVLWDIYGWDDFQSLKMSYLRGMSGYLLVADGTRRSTVDDALLIAKNVEKEFRDIPFVFLLNKNDLADEWEVDREMENGLAGRGWPVMRSSAKTGEGVEAAFVKLGHTMLT